MASTDNENASKSKRPHGELTTSGHSTNVAWHDQSVSAASRLQCFSNPHFRPCVLWFTGLSGSGKSTLANATSSALVDSYKIPSYVLDGDNVRHGLCSDLGFSPVDRTENIRRIGEVAALMSDAGSVVCTAFVSPYRKDREDVRSIMCRKKNGERDISPSQDDKKFVEIYCDADLASCEGRDTKGLYKMARAGKIKDFTGIGSPYEEPEEPDLVVKTGGERSVEECLQYILDYLKEKGIIDKRVKNK